MKKQNFPEKTIFSGATRWYWQLVRQPSPDESVVTSGLEDYGGPKQCTTRCFRFRLAEALCHSLPRLYQLLHLRAQALALSGLRRHQLVTGLPETAKVFQEIAGVTPLIIHLPQTKSNSLVYRLEYGKPPRVADLSCSRLRKPAAADSDFAFRANTADHFALPSPWLRLRVPGSCAPCHCINHITQKSEVTPPC